MKNFSTRIRLIYYPFLVIAVSFILIYTFLNWLFVIRLEMPVNEDLVNFWLLFALPWIPVLIWLRPRIRLLVLKDKKGNLPFLYQFIACAAIVAPTFVAQQYLPTATGKLTVLQNISKISNKPLTKYYRLKHYSIDKRHFVAYRRTATSGRNNEYLDFYKDMACPILVDSIKSDTAVRISAANIKKALIVIDNIPAAPGTQLNKIKPDDIKNIDVLKDKSAVALYGPAARYGAILITTRKGAGDANYLQPRIPKAWLCLEFRKSLSNRLSDDEKGKEFQDFDSTSANEFKEKNLDRFVYLDRIGMNDRHKGYIKAINGIFPPTNKTIILEAVNEPFEARNGNKLGWIFKSFFLGAAIWLLMIIIPKFDTVKAEGLAGNELKSGLNAAYNAIAVFKPRSSFQITAIIVGLNVLMFIIMVFAGLGFISFEAGDLFKWGANYRPAIVSGQWWRLLTNIFLHGGLMHLLLNMYGLFFAAIFLEPLLGKLRYASAYLICGIVASLASIWWHPATVSIGASGAIFGLYGILLALSTTNKVDLKNKKSMLIFSLVFIGINLVMGLAGGIDNAAHIGGVTCGLALGYIFYFFTDLPEIKEKNPEIEKAN